MTYMNEKINRPSQLVKKLKPSVTENLGKLPPQALDLEEAVLGALMLEKSALAQVDSFLKADDFYSEAHQVIYEAILSLSNESKPVDMRTVVHKLRSTGKLELIGGVSYIAELTSKVSSAANLEYHGRIVIECSLKRKMIRIQSDLLQAAYEDSTDVFELMEEAERLIFEINKNHENYSVSKDGVQLGHELMKKIQLASQRDDGLTGVPSGFVSLDRFTHGWQPNELIIVAARPGMGKTSWLLSNVNFLVANLNIPVGIFSLEMDSLALMSRLYSMDTEIDSEKIRTGKLLDIEWERLRNSRVSSKNLHIDDTGSLTIASLRGKVRRWVAYHEVKIVFLDYLQLMSLATAEKTAGMNREQEIAKISRSLKLLAKECGIPIIAFSQLSRAVETRGGDKRPMLSDLRESGSIEQDADLVGFLYRPEYYKITVDEDGLPTQGVAEFIIAKHRNGNTGTVKMKFIGKYTKFLDATDLLSQHPSWTDPGFNPNLDQEPGF